MEYLADVSVIDRPWKEKGGNASTEVSMKIE